MAYTSSSTFSAEGAKKLKEAFEEGWSKWDDRHKDDWQVPAVPAGARLMEVSRDAHRDGSITETYEYAVGNSTVTYTYKVDRDGMKTLLHVDESFDPWREAPAVPTPPEKSDRFYETSGYFKGNGSSWSSGSMSSGVKVEFTPRIPHYEQEATADTDELARVGFFAATAEAWGGDLDTSEWPDAISEDQREWCRAFAHAVMTRTAEPTKKNLLNLQQTLTQMSSLLGKLKGSMTQSSYEQCIEMLQKGHKWLYQRNKNTPEPKRRS